MRLWRSCARIRNDLRPAPFDESRDVTPHPLFVSGPAPDFDYDEPGVTLPRALFGFVGGFGFHADVP